MCERERRSTGNLICNALLDKLKTIAISQQVTADVSCRSCVMRRNEISERCIYASRPTYRFLFVFPFLPLSCNPSSHLRNSARALTRVFSLTSPSGCIFQIRMVRGRRLRARISPFPGACIFIHLFQLQRRLSPLYSATFAKYLLAYLIHRSRPLKMYLHFIQFHSEFL